MRNTEARVTPGVIAARQGDVEQAVHYGERALTESRNVAVIAVMAVVAVLVFVWARSRNKPPPGPGGAQREEGSPAGTAPPGASGWTS